MQQPMLTVKFVTVLSLFGLGGCSDHPAEKPQQPIVYTAHDHNRIYKEGCNLISPYMRLHGVSAKPANTAKAREELQRGILLLQKVVEINPRNWSAYWVMGKGYQALDDSDSACDAFGKSFAVQKDNPDVAREYMFECLNLGRAEEGLVAAKRGVALKPDDSGLIANLALAHLINGELNEAIACVDKSLTLAPDDEITQNLKKIIRDVQRGKRARPSSMRDL